MNVTIDDTSSLIAYSANNTWRPSTVPCTTCLAPSDRLAYAGTWHDGTHIIPTADGDDTQTTAENPGQSGKPGQNGNGGDGDGGKGGGGGGDDDGGDGGKGSNDEEDSDEGDDDDKKGDTDDNDDKKGGKGSRQRRGLKGNSGRRFKRQNTASNPFFTPSLDSDDSGFVDKPVTVQFNFTGTSCWLLSISQLSGHASASSTEKQGRAA